MSSPQYGYRYLIKVKTDVIYLFYFIMPASVTCYSIIMDVALVMEATERHFVYFEASKLMFLASYSFHFVM